MSLLAGYYQAIDAENQAKADQARVQSGLISQQAQQVAPDAASTRNEQAARATSELAGARRQNAETSQIPLNDASTRASQGASANLATVQAQQLPLSTASEDALRNASTRATGIQTDITRNSAFGGLPGFGGTPSGGGLVVPSSSVLSTGVDGLPIQGYEKGGSVKTERSAVQGKAPKPGPSDTVPAMLTPGEAVLNKGAAEHYGTDVINHMNKMGLMRMGAQSEVAKHLGLPDPHAPSKASGKAQDGKRKSKGTGAPQMAQSAATGSPSAGMPGYAKGGMVMPQLAGFMTTDDRASIAANQKQLDPTSYGLGILHGASLGQVATPTKDGKSKAARG